jgi:hypothetical protein
MRCHAGPDGGIFMLALVDITAVFPADIDAQMLPGGASASAVVCERDEMYA